MYVWMNVLCELHLDFHLAAAFTVIAVVQEGCFQGTWVVVTYWLNSQLAECMGTVYGRRTK